MKIEVRNSCDEFNSYRSARVKSLFNCDSGANFSLDADIPDDLDWRLGVIVGPSGSGKTSIGRILWPDVGIYDGDADWPGDTAEDLWRRDLCLMGVEMLTEVVAEFAAGGYRHGAPQDEELATWEPSIDRPPVFRPDLVMLQHLCGD